jgi:hypothetical protein
MKSLLPYYQKKKKKRTKKYEKLETINIMVQLLALMGHVFGPGIAGSLDYL